MARIERGVCENCDAPVPQGDRFCDEDCAQDWRDRATSAARRSGRTHHGAVELRGEEKAATDEDAPA